MGKGEKEGKHEHGAERGGEKLAGFGNNIEPWAGLEGSSKKSGYLGLLGLLGGGGGGVGGGEQVRRGSNTGRLQQCR